MLAEIQERPVGSRVPDLRVTPLESLPGDMTTAQPASVPQAGVSAGESPAAARTETASDLVGSATSSTRASLSPVVLERNHCLAALLQGLATRRWGMPGADTASAQLAGALVAAQTPSPEELAASMQTFVRALTTGLECADHGNEKAAARTATSPDVLPGPAKVLRQRARRTCGEPVAEEAGAPADEPMRGVAVRLAHEMAAEQQRTAAQWLAESRAELPIPVDVSGGIAWVRLRVQRRATPRAAGDPPEGAALALLVELPTLGLVYVAAALSSGHLRAGIHTSNEPTASWLRERRTDLEAAMGTAGLRGWSVDIRADPALVAREWAPWPLPTLDGGSLVDARA